MIDVIEKTAVTILEQIPGIVVRYRLLRDALRKASNCPELQQAKDNLQFSQCIQELEQEQWEDGGWGAFHTRSTRVRQKIPSTEVGVERALSLGLDASHPILRNASAYILGIMHGNATVPRFNALAHLS